MIQFDRSICGDLSRALDKEWLETNGLGGFASSTIVGLNTRRYHGLLTAALHPPVGRMVLLSKLEETLIAGGQRIELGCNEYSGAVYPEGFRCLNEFRLDPFPIFVYEAEGVRLTKTLFMKHGQNTTVIQYSIEGPPDAPDAEVSLELRPLLAFRDYHSTSHENPAVQREMVLRDGLIALTPYAGQPSLYLAHNAAEVRTHADWFRNFNYRVERERGLDFSEDLFNPCVLRFQLRKDRPASIIASTSEQRAGDAAAMLQQELVRRRALRNAAGSGDSLVADLAAAADQYIVARGDRHSIIAGYPWFGDWGRDTMIALPGLTLSTGRPEIAHSIIDAFAAHISQGMLPNRFPDAGEEPEYNTVDATLWYFEAIRAWLEATGDEATVRERWYAMLCDIIDWHARGTRHGIRLDADGLLHSGEPGVQLTWMDAKLGDWVVTPRQGKAVEIQALWYNALRVMEDLARRFNDSSRETRFTEMANRARESFSAKFWNTDSNCLFDVVDDGGTDASFRPNQIFAVSLPHSMLGQEQSRAVVQAVARELLTPLGLRTLPRNDPRYVPHYIGGPHERDASYHQGTVWPWLVGPFITAYLKIEGFSETSRQQARQWLRPFAGHLRDAGLGQISEICDAEPNHAPRGCFAQAWSVAEILRATLLVDAPPAVATVKSGSNASRGKRAAMMPQLV